MKKNILDIKSLWALLLVAVFSMAFAACSDKDSVGGTPEITGVKVLSSDTTNYKYDNYYTKAGAGTMLAIMGNNLGHTLEVYINNQKVAFNSTMNTDHSIIVSVPTEEKDSFKLSAFDSSIPDEIRVVTGGGTAVYAFKITAPGPQLQRVEAIYPRNPGDVLKLHGLNLLDIEKIYITDVSAATLDTTKWTEVPGNHVAITDYKSVKQKRFTNSSNTFQTESELEAVVPENVPENGALVIECAAGTTYYAFYRRPGTPVISSVSSDMPEIGETLVITGREFVQIESIKYGDITLTPDEFTVSQSEDSIFIPFTKKPSVGSEASITITTPGGTATANNFYDYTTILTTFDGDAADNGWDPKPNYGDAGNADGKYAQIKVKKEFQQWWGTMVYYRKDWDGNTFPLSSNIPSTAPADKVYFAFEVYDNGSSFNNGDYWGYLRYMIQPADDSENQYDNFGWADYDSGVGMFPDGPTLGDYEGNAYKNKWYRVVIPLSKFGCYKGKTYADIVKTGLHQFRIQSINQGTHQGKIDVRIDNVRVIYLP